MSKIREKESLECVRMHIWASKTQKLPGPLSGPWNPAAECSLRLHDSSSLCRQLSASEAGAPPWPNPGSAPGSVYITQHNIETQHSLSHFRSRAVYLSHKSVLLISLHIRSTWETICDAQAGFCTLTSNRKFVSKLSTEPHSGISDHRAPPPNWNLGRSWHFEYVTLESPSPPPKLLVGVSVCGDLNLSYG